MKILISEEQAKKVLLELHDTRHVAERLGERCMHGKLPVAVRKTVYLGRGQEMEHLYKVGDYTFSENEKKELRDKILQIFSYDYNRQSYGVALQRFNIKNRFDKIEFYDETCKQEALKYKDEKNGGLYFVDFDDEKYDIYGREKYADSVALIIRNNDAVTVMWGRMEKFNKKFYRTDNEITKISSLIKFGATKPAKIPDEIKRIYGIDDGPDGGNLPPDSGSSSELPNVEPKQDDVDLLNPEKI